MKRLSTVTAMATLLAAGLTTSAFAGQLDAIKGDKMSGGGWFMGNNNTFHYSVNASVTKKGVRGSSSP